jgi:hypothetical protein
MVDTSQFVAWLALWLIGLGIVLWGNRHDSRGAGLVLAYALQLWVIHWLAPAIYTLPWYFAPTPTLQAGLEQSTFAILGLAVGAVVLGPLLIARIRAADDVETVSARADSWLVHSYLWIGVVAYVLQPFVNGIPTLTALTSVTSNLLLVAFAMECWNGLQRPNRSVWRWIALSTLLPFVSIVTSGFLSYGFAAMLTVFAFVASVYRPRWKVIAFGAVASFLALSMYVTYMRDRAILREVIWGEEAYSVRLNEMANTFTNFEFLDLGNIDHLQRIDDRLNQNALVGAAVEYLGQRPEEFAHGQTIRDALLSPIPRAIWRNKPMAAGSGDLVTRFTGIRFAEGTSVGIGHVMEWYVNFGSWAVFLGSVFMGILLAAIDKIAIGYMRRGDLPGFALWYLPAIGLLQIGGSLVEAVSGAAAGLVVGLLIHRARPRHLRGAPGVAARKRTRRGPFVPQSVGGLRRARW